MKLYLCALALTTATASVHPSEADTIFAPGAVPKCWVHNGRTIVHYAGRHASFKCTHTGSKCSCAWKHPTHHTGLCMEFDHTDGTNHNIGGDCNDSGLNAIDGGWSGYTYGTCSKSCGTGTQSMTRACDSPAPFNAAGAAAGACSAQGCGADCAGSATTSQNCNTHACATDCVVPAFDAWSTCTKSCGTGSQKRSRATVEPTLGGVACPHSTETRACNTAACATDCVTEGFGAWSTCTKSCGTGSQKRSRAQTEPTLGGVACPHYEETRACNTAACATDCVTESWAAWSTCTKSCGTGSQKRSRAQAEPTFGGVACPHYDETRACNEHACPVDCVTNGWSAWSTCTKSCEAGFQSRTRTNTAPQNGGGACPHTAETQACNHGPCPVHCATSTFSGWSTCTKSCGTGSQSRSRTVTASAANGGYVCPYLAETQNCNTGTCAIDGTWSSYTAYSTCSRSCATGTQSRTRTCDGQAFGGKACVGSTTDTRNCNTHACPVNGGWSGYSYAACSKSCGTGTQTLTRSCNSPSVANGGANCAGSATSSQNCNTHACPVNGGWSGWSGWGSCSKDCDSGTKSRSRSCNSPSVANGGANCDGSTTESTSCNTQSCYVPSCNGFGGYERTCNENNWHSKVKTSDFSNGCQFHVETDEDTCDQYCDRQGSYCLGGQDNEDKCDLDDRHTRQTTGDNGCDQNWGDQVCVCAKK